jgi:hypothetical protein
MTVSINPTNRSLRLKWELHLKSNKKITDYDLEIYKQDIKNLNRTL